MRVKILLVDDNRDILSSYNIALQQLLEKGESTDIYLSEMKISALDIEIADAVELAVDKLNTQKFDILVVDLKIPGFSGDVYGGLELIDEALIIDPLIQIIAITGYGSIDLARKTLTQGVFDFIEKSATAIDDLLKSIQRAIQKGNEKILRSGNPFTPMTGLEPTIFGGRINELRFFEERLDRAINSNFCEHFLVLGDWGIGKSTLFKEYKKICQSRGHLAAIVPLEAMQPGSKLIEAALSIIEGIFRDLPYPIDRFKKVSKYLNAVGISILGSGFQLGWDTSKKELSPQALLHDTLHNLWLDLKDQTDVFIILLDDLENFMAVSEIVMTLKTTLSMTSIMQTKILIGLSATNASWLELTTPKKHNPLSRYFINRIELEPLKKEEQKKTILNSLAGSGVSFHADIVEKIFDNTQGHPFEMQVLCYHLFNNQVGRRVDDAMWDKALQTTLKDLGIAVFDHLFQQASESEVKVLKFIAASEDHVPLKDIQWAIEKDDLDVPKQNVSKHLQRLVEKSLLMKTGRGIYAIPDKMFCAYIRGKLD